MASTINIQGKFNSVAADGILADATQLAGGCVVVADTTARDALGTGIKNSGALVFVSANSTFYRYVSSSWQSQTIGSVTSVNGRTGAVETYRGVYNSSATYNAGDIISYDSDCYICISATTAGTLPTNTTYFKNIGNNLSVQNYTYDSTAACNLNSFTTPGLYLITAYYFSNGPTFLPQIKGSITTTYTIWLEVEDDYKYSSDTYLTQTIDDSVHFATRYRDGNTFISSWVAWTERTYSNIPTDSQITTWNGKIDSSYVVANDSGTASTALTSLKVGSTTYSISAGGTSVEANPSASASTALTKVTIGSTTYSIPSAGSVTLDTEQTFTAKKTFDVGDGQADTAVQVGSSLSYSTRLMPVGALSRFDSAACSTSLQARGIVFTKLGLTDGSPTSAHSTKLLVNPAVDETDDDSDVVYMPASGGTLALLSDIPSVPTVVANPSGTATNTLTKLNINGAIYSLPSGGSSSFSFSSVPSSTSSSGTAGDMAVGYENSTYYLYVCVSSNTWRRVSLSTWSSGGGSASF